jgi:hypothetical protein
MVWAIPPSATTFLPSSIPIDLPSLHTISSELDDLPQLKAAIQG